MDQEIQDYLLRIAIKTKIDNYKEFQKSKEEVENAIRKTFDLSEEKAKQYVEDMWDSNQLFERDASWKNKKAQLLYEKEQMIIEYDKKLEVIEDVILGFSPENIAKSRKLTLEEVQRILEG